MTSSQHFDAIIIGSGQGGNPLAVDLVAAGRKTALIEREYVGGTCVNVGCTPTKTMIASGRVAYLARRGADYGVGTAPIAIDMVRVRQRKRDIVDQFRSGGEHRLMQGGVELIRGEASFTGPHELAVQRTDGESLSPTADLIVIDTGTRPVIPDLPGLDTVPYLTSATIMELGEVPEHLLVLGGGYIGLEFGQLFRRLGARVTVVQRSRRLLPREDTDVTDAVTEILREDGIEVLTDAEARGVGRSEDGTISLTVCDMAGERILTGSHLLIAVGRRPNTEVLHLERAGIERDPHGFVKIDDRLETTVPGVYAIGDVSGNPAFTHISYDDYRILRTNLLEGGNRTRAGRLIPYTMFIDPQLGRVGISEKEAEEQGRAIVVAKMPMKYVARAKEVDETRGFIKAMVDARNGQILGAYVLGIEGGEIMAMFEIAMIGNLPYTALRDGIFAHPTLAELMNNLFADTHLPSQATEQMDGYVDSDEWMGART